MSAPCTVQQFKCGQIATARSDVHRDAVRGIGAAFEQHLGKRDVTHGNERAPKRGPRKFAMPVPIVFAVGVCTLAAQFTGNLDKSVRSFRRTVMQTRVAHVKQRLPILCSASLDRRLRMGSQAGLHGFGIAKHELGEQVRVRDAWMPRQQPLSAALGASSGAANELVHSGRKGKRVHFHVLARVVPGFETIFAGDDELRVMHRSFPERQARMNGCQK